MSAAASASLSISVPAPIAGSQPSPGAKNTTAPSRSRFAMIICGINYSLGLRRPAPFWEARILHSEPRPDRSPQTVHKNCG